LEAWGAWSLCRRKGVEVSYGSLVPYIVNRDKTGCCPMEQAVKDATDVEVGYQSVGGNLPNTAKAQYRLAVAFTRRR